MKGKLNAVHPGFVQSKMDGEWHYITYGQLIRLYKLCPVDCVLWDDRQLSTFICRNRDNYNHFYPRSDGKYPVFEEDERRTL